MVSVTVHLFCTNLIVYGAMVISYGKRLVDYKYGAIYFLCAISFHGLFDLPLITETLYDFWLFSYVLVIFAVYGLNNMYNYALNISPNYIDAISIDNRKIQQYLLIAFTSIFFFAFILGSIINGYHTSYDLLVDSLMGFALLLAFIATGLSGFVLIYGHRTGLFGGFEKFRYPDLLNSKIIITLLNNKQLTTQTHEIWTSFRICIKEKTDYILSSTEKENPYQGFSNLLLVPTMYTEGKNKKYYNGKLYGLESRVEDLYNEPPLLKPLGNFEIIIPDKQKDPKKSIMDRINAGGYIFIGIVLLSVFIYYMEYKSARQAYRWAFDFLEIKGLYKASNNMKYALSHDGSYSEAHLLSAKIALNLNDYEGCIKHCEEASPNNYAQNLTSNYLIAKSLYQMKKYEEAEKYFNKLLNDPETSDSANFYKSKLYIIQKKYPEALALLEKTFPTSKDDEINFIKIQHLVESGKYAKADTILKKDIVKCGKNLPAYYYWTGCSALAGSDTSKACYNFTESRKLNYGPGVVAWGIHCYSQTKNDSLLVNP